MLNCCILIGRLTRDPQLRRFEENENSSAVVNFGIATDRDYSKNGEKITDFFEVRAWNRNADFADKYLKKEQLICVKGSLCRADWNDKNTGEKRFSYYLEADNIYFADNKKEPDEAKKGENKPNDGFPNDFDPFGGI